MVGVAMFTYGLLTSFVLSGASHNRRLQRPNPMMLERVGYVLFGMSASASVLLMGKAAVMAIA
ncbi:hypothetical protein SAMN05192583_2653 [Sphingomonas gellani]|uniref:Uncharacterized protein n=1 Tax=Sphingomonas gellani TaxID=1166340 RepID=A0A1H8G0Z9_9SPHN|nr:hypothetical protein [Sphingomonas gellani]SEN37673.1 hypothetical protein SAMN05192583_2653 [Sphingomonas gellani]